MSIEKAQEVVFEDVHVVPMDREGVMEHRDVVVRDGRIDEIVPAATAMASTQALRIRVTGKYLMPGLADMHMHLPGPEAGPEASEALLFLFLANGITRIRSMAGVPEHVQLRRQLQAGEILGPRATVAGPPLGGSSLPAAALAREVERQAAAGYDFVKVHPGLTREAYDAISAAAAGCGLPVCGHVARDVGLLPVLEARQSSIEHLDGYVEALQSQAAPGGPASLQELCAGRGRQRTERAIAHLAAATREAGVWNVPTLLVSETLRSGEGPPSLRRRAGPAVRLAADGGGVGRDQAAARRAGPGPHRPAALPAAPAPGAPGPGRAGGQSAARHVLRQRVRGPGLLGRAVSSSSNRARLASTTTSRSRSSAMNPRTRGESRSRSAARSPTAAVPSPTRGSGTSSHQKLRSRKIPCWISWNPARTACSALMNAGTCPLNRRPCRSASRRRTGTSSGLIEV